MNKLQSKIKELKERAGHIEYGTISVNVRGKLTTTASDKLDERVITGYLCVWGERNSFGEKFVKGAFAKSIKERGPNSNAKYKITFLWQHDQTDPLALFAVLTEDDYGLYFETKPLDNVPNADRALMQIKSGTLNQFSIGWDYVYDKIDWDDADDSLIIKEADLFEGSIVTIGADEETFAIRSRETVELLHDMTEDFIDSLPRQYQLEARKMFTRHKTLFNKDAEPLERRQKHSDIKEKPSANAGKYDYVLNNL